MFSINSNAGFRGVSDMAGTKSDLSVANLRANVVSTDVNPAPDMLDISTLSPGTTTIPLGQKDLYIIGINGADQSVLLNIDLNATRPDNGRRVTIYNDSNAQVQLTFAAPITLTANRAAAVSPTPLFNPGPSDPVQYAFLFGNGNQIRLVGISI